MTQSQIEYDFFDHLIVFALLVFEVFIEDWVVKVYILYIFFLIHTWIFVKTHCLLIVS